MSCLNWTVPDFDINVIFLTSSSRENTFVVSIPSQSISNAIATSNKTLLVDTKSRYSQVGDSGCMLYCNGAQCGQNKSMQHAEHALHTLEDEELTRVSACASGTSKLGKEVWLGGGYQVASTGGEVIGMKGKSLYEIRSLRQ